MGPDPHRLSHVGQRPYKQTLINKTKTKQKHETCHGDLNQPEYDQHTYRFHVSKKYLELLPGSTNADIVRKIEDQKHIILGAAERKILKGGRDTGRVGWSLDEVDVET